MSKSLATPDVHLYEHHWTWNMLLTDSKGQRIDERNLQKLDLCRAHILPCSCVHRYFIAYINKQWSIDRCFVSRVACLDPPAIRILNFNKQTIQRIIFTKEIAAQSSQFPLDVIYQWTNNRQRNCPNLSLWKKME